MVGEKLGCTVGSGAAIRRRSIAADQVEAGFGAVDTRAADKCGESWQRRPESDGHVRAKYKCELPHTMLNQRHGRLANAALRSTFYYQQDPVALSPRALTKGGPKTSYTDEALTGHLRQVFTTSPYLGKCHYNVWERLRAAQ